MNSELLTRPFALSATSPVDETGSERQSALREGAHAKSRIRPPTDFSSTQWFLKLPEIIATLEALKTPVLDSKSVQVLFTLKERSAQNLMSQLGAFRAGSAYCLDRVKLIKKLRRIKEGKAFDEESERRENLAASLETARKEQAASKVRIEVTPEVFAGERSKLPEGIEFLPQEIRVKGTALEIAAKLFALSQMMLGDFESFEKLVGLPVRRTEPISPTAALPEISVERDRTDQPLKDFEKESSSHGR